MTKTIHFANGSTVEYLDRITDRDFIQGADREVLEFRFDPDTVSMDQIDSLFNETNCVKITATETIINKVPHYKTVEVEEPIIGEDGEPTGETTTRTEVQLDYTEDVPITSEFVYDNYVVRSILSRQLFPIQGESGIEYKDYIAIRIGQQTYSEAKIIAMNNDITNTQIALVDVYETILGG